MTKKPFFENENVTLYHGNCVEVLKEIKQEAFNNILIVSNNSSWAIRSRNLFEDQWLKKITSANFENPSDITASISRAVGVEASNSRKESIDKILRRPIKFLPRTRTDIDAIIAFISPSESETLESILKFHFLEESPVYASSQSELHNRSYSEWFSEEHLEDSAAQALRYREMVKARG